VGNSSFDHGDGANRSSSSGGRLPRGPRVRLPPPVYFGTQHPVSRTDDGQPPRAGAVKAKLEPIPDSEERRLRLRSRGAPLTSTGTSHPDTIPSQRDHRCLGGSRPPGTRLAREASGPAPEATGGGSQAVSGSRGKEAAGPIILTESRGPDLRSLASRGAR